MQILDHENFEGAQVLAEIGAKIAEGRAELANLESSKQEFLTDRASEATERIKRVLETSKELIGEIEKYHSELVGFRDQIGVLADDARELIQSIERWKKQFDETNAALLADIDKKLKENSEILLQIKANRALLEGEKEGIETKRAALRLDRIKINDEWAALERAANEINNKKS